MAWPQIETLRSVTRQAGFELRERLAAYPEYLRDSEWMAEPLRQRALAFTDEAGLVK
jgi:FO synthase